MMGKKKQTTRRTSSVVKQQTEQRKPSSSVKEQKQKSASSSENAPRNIFILDATQPHIFEYTRFGSKISLTIHQSADEDTWPGGAVWDLAHIMGRLLVSWTRGCAAVECPSALSLYSNIVWKDTTVLELGCGTGLTGLVAASLGAKVTLLTDLQVVVENVTRLNVEENAQPGPSKTCGYRTTRAGGKVVELPLCWGNEEDEEATQNKLQEMLKSKDQVVVYPDWILVGDIAYQQKPGAPSHFDVFLSTLLRFVGPNTKVLFGTRMRMPASQDLLQMLRTDLVEQVYVPAHELDPRLLEVGRKHNMTIHIFEKRQNEQGEEPIIA